MKANDYLQPSLTKIVDISKSNAKKISNIGSLGNVARNDSNVHEIGPLDLLYATEEKIWITFKRNWGGIWSLGDLKTYKWKENGAHKVKRGSIETYLGG